MLACCKNNYHGLHKLVRIKIFNDNFLSKVRLGAVTRRFDRTPEEATKGSGPPQNTEQQELLLSQNGTNKFVKLNRVLTQEK